MNDFNVSTSFQYADQRKLYPAVSKNTNLPLNVVKLCCDEFVKQIVASLKNGKEVQLRRLGTFGFRRRMRKTGFDYQRNTMIYLVDDACKIDFMMSLPLKRLTVLPQGKWHDMSQLRITRFINKTNSNRKTKMAKGCSKNTHATDMSVKGNKLTLSLLRKSGHVNLDYKIVTDQPVQQPYQTHLSDNHAQKEE